MTLPRALEIIFNYVARTYRVKECGPIEHCAALRPWGRDLRWAFPRDGKRQTLEGAGISLATQYGAQGLNMLPEPACFEDGSVSVQAGIMKMLTMMQSGPFKVFEHKIHDLFAHDRRRHQGGLLVPVGALSSLPNNQCNRICGHSIVTTTLR
jgi:hypothetical protein